MCKICKRVAPVQKTAARSSIWLESPAHNGEVVGSSPTGRTTKVMEAKKGTVTIHSSPSGQEIRIFSSLAG